MRSSKHPKPPLAPLPWDKFSLYELCAQNPPRDARLLRAIHADSARVPRRSPAVSSGAPLTLAEDFSGTAALSRAWCALSPSFRAVATDIDAPTLARAKRLTPPDLAERITFRRANVLRIADKADLIAVLNFSIGEIHARPDLVNYFKRCRARLTARGGGALVCDIYGGADSFTTGLLDQTVKPPRTHPFHRDRILYSWEQRSADPLTGEAVNAMHFEVKGPRARPEVFLDAFVYHWRLWSIPELRDAMAEAGFRTTRVYSRMADATDAEGNLYVRPIEDPTDLGDSFNVFVVGR